MADSTNPRAVPQGYQRIEGSERRLAPGTRLVGGADPNQILPVVIRVQADAGQAGLDRVVAFARARGLGLVATNAGERSVVLWGTVGQMSEIFAVSVNVYESPAETYRGCEGHLHLPAGLAGIVENVLGLIEHEIEHIEHVTGGLPRHGPDEGPGVPRRVFDLTVPLSGPKGAVNAAEFSLAQQFDVDWLADPGCRRMLDNMAASPTAFQTVRVMKVFTSGTPETGTGATTSSGTVWPAGGTINLTSTLNALHELTSRGLVPFVVLGFFPDGIYTGTASGVSGVTGPDVSAIPAADWTKILANWRTLVQTFFEALTADVRFGAGAIAQWWFEVWNEPDNPAFWTPDASTADLGYYQQLYEATSEVVTANGYNIRLGGPAIMGTSVTGTNLMSPFIDFVTGKTTGQALKCDFLSFHGKGEWDGCLNGQPVLQSAVDAADQTASMAQNAGLTTIKVINNEADMRANFAVPFRPRMTGQFPAWLTAMMVAYDSLSSQYAPIRCMAGSDNAELQLVGLTQQVPGGPASFAPAAFGQQRSLMTAASSWSSGTCPIDLLKVPVYNFYELLRLLGDQHGTFLTGGSNYYPHNSDLFHMITVAATHIGSVFCVYPPNPSAGPAQSPWTLNVLNPGHPLARDQLVPIPDRRNAFERLQCCRRPGSRARGIVLHSTPIATDCASAGPIACKRNTASPGTERSGVRRQRARFRRKVQHCPEHPRVHDNGVLDHRKHKRHPGHTRLGDHRPHYARHDGLRNERGTPAGNPTRTRRSTPTRSTETPRRPSSRPLRYVPPCGSTLTRHLGAIHTGSVPSAGPPSRAASRRR